MRIDPQELALGADLGDPNPGMFIDIGKSLILLGYHLLGTGAVGDLPSIDECEFSHAHDLTNPIFPGTRPYGAPQPGPQRPTHSSAGRFRLRDPGQVSSFVAWS